MKIHIVQVNEKITEISKKYNISVEEIIKNNRHINNFENIAPGMKLKLPILSDELIESLKDNVLDIEKYYPKLENLPEFTENKVQDKQVNQIKDKEIKTQEVITSAANNINPNMQYYYQYYQNQLYPYHINANLNPNQYYNQVTNYPYQYYQNYPVQQNYQTSTIPPSIANNERANYFQQEEVKEEKIVFKPPKSIKLDLRQNVNEPKKRERNSLDIL